MSTPNILIVTGYGLNCEAESRFAWEQAGARVDEIHLNDLIAEPNRLLNYAGLMFIGGFSYGDHMGSGLAFALRVKHRLGDALTRFIEDERLILGVCNGFQVMTKIGLLPGFDGDYSHQKIALMQNDCGAFQNYWVRLRFESDRCVFTRGLDLMDLPIRHGEGKLFTPDRRVRDRLEQDGHVVCRYADPDTNAPATQPPANPNGSLNAIAGLCDPTGRIFGLMPHPEAYLFPENHPQWLTSPTRTTTGAGLQLFSNAVSHLSS